MLRVNVISELLRTEKTPAKKKFEMVFHQGLLNQLYALGMLMTLLGLVLMLSNQLIKTH